MPDKNTYLLFRTLALMAIDFVALPDHSDAFAKPKNTSEANAANNTPPSMGHLEGHAISLATDRCKPLTRPRVPYSAGAVNRSHGLGGAQ